MHKNLRTRGSFRARAGNRASAKLLRTQRSFPSAQVGLFAHARSYAQARVFSRMRERLRKRKNLLAHARPFAQARVSSRMRPSLCVSANYCARAEVFPLTRQLLRPRGNLYAHAPASAQVRESICACAASCACAGVFAPTRTSAQALKRFRASATFCESDRAFSLIRELLRTRENISRMTDLLRTSGSFGHARLYGPYSESSFIDKSASKSGI